MDYKLHQVRLDGWVAEWPSNKPYNPQHGYGFDRTYDYVIVPSSNPHAARFLAEKMYPHWAWPWLEKRQEDETKTRSYCIELVEELLKNAHAREGLEYSGGQIIGSSYIQSSDFKDDVDYIFMANPEHFELWIDYLEQGGWYVGGSECVGENDDWASLKHPDNKVNLILVKHSQYYHDWKKAAEVCKFLHDAGVELDKPKVCAVHAIVMDDWDTEKCAEAYNILFKRDRWEPSA